jgi:hypothetical protein
MVIPDLPSCRVAATKNKPFMNEFVQRRRITRSVVDAAPLLNHRY